VNGQVEFILKQAVVKRTKALPAEEPEAPPERKRRG
jgi:hypothetical protein